jgi:phosphoglycerate kinase
MKSLRDISLAHRTVFLRVDFNVPLNDEGEIVEDARIKAAMTTIEYCVQQGARLVIGSHLGRPDGQVVYTMSLHPVAERLEELLGREIQFVNDCIGPEVEEAKARLEDGDILLLENLRFYPGEEANDLHFAENLSQGIDVYVDDAFGAIHRKHASVAALASLIFDRAPGFLLEEEIRALSTIVNRPEKPFVIIVGGMKLSDKVNVIEHLAPIAEAVLVGGGVANTFLKAAGVKIGASKVEATDAESILKRTDKIVLPVDVVVAGDPDATDVEVIDVANGIPDDKMILDIGPKTRELFSEHLAKAKTIFWNGPMGLFENPAFLEGSKAVATAVAESNAYTVLGGGDTESLVTTCKLTGRFTHVSTGGGASLSFVAGESLPGIDALQD